MKTPTIILMLITALISGCNDSDAQIASHNLSKKADNFELQRRVVFYNGFSDTYMLTIEGRCSIKADGMDRQLEVTCKTSDTAFKKHFLGLSDNVTYFSEQLTSKNVSAYHYNVVFKPQSIIPDIDINTSLN